MPIFHSYADEQPNVRTVALNPTAAVYHLFETLSRLPQGNGKPRSGRVVFTKPDGVEEVMAELTLHYPPRL